MKKVPLKACNGAYISIAAGLKYFFRIRNYEYVMNLFYPEAEIDDDLLNRKIEMLVRVIESLMAFI